MQIHGKQASADQDYFLSLGAGHHQVPLIEAAIRKGMSVIAVDKNPLAEGFEKAELQLHASILKPFWIYRAIEEHFPRGQIRAVGSRSYGPAVLSASYLARRFGVPGSSPHSLIRFQDKNRLKGYLASHGIAVPERVPWKPGKDPSDVLRKRGIWIARSGKGSAKQGIQVLATHEEKKQYLEKHTRRSPENRSLFIERYVQGSEFIVYGMVLSGRFHALTLTEKVISDLEPRFADRRHIFPARISEENARSMVETCQKIVDLCKYDNGPFFAEFIIPKRSKNPRPLLVECQPEVGGEFLADCLIPAAAALLCWVIGFLSGKSPATTLQASLLLWAVISVGEAKYVSQSTLAFALFTACFTVPALFQTYGARLRGRAAAAGAQAAGAWRAASPGSRKAALAALGLAFLHLMNVSSNASRAFLAFTGVVSAQAYAGAGPGPGRRKGKGLA